MSKIEISRAPRLADKQTGKEFFYGMPMIERGKPLVSEMLWVLLERRDWETHEKVLPDYCYNIFDVFQKTYFKGFPLFSETLVVIDQAGLKSAKTVEQTKKVLRINWKNMGRLFGMAARCIRFAEMETANGQDGDEFGDLTPEKTKELFTLICGRVWVENDLPVVNGGTVDEKLAALLNQYLAPWLAKLQAMHPKMNGLARTWSPAAMLQFHEGLAEGMEAFMNTDGRLVGESSRSGIYGFLLLAWPEVKAMLESTPKKTLSDLHEWMKPFMRVGITTYIEIETLRDVCAPPPSGIGLSLRPLKVRSAKSSA
jgi:hypothetical protein